VERAPSAGRNQPVAGSLVEVQVLQLPLELWQRAQEHTDGLVRELALIVQDAEARAATPRRLLGLVRELNAAYGESSEEQRREMEAALECGQSARGDHLLTLPRRRRSSASGAGSSASSSSSSAVLRPPRGPRTPAAERWPPGGRRGRLTRA